MKKRNLAALSFICLSLCTLLFSCAEPEENFIFGTWYSPGPITVQQDITGDTGDEIITLTNITMVFSSGSYSFSYTATEPTAFPAGDASSQAGSMSPAEPIELEGILCTVQSVSGGFHPDVGDTFHLRYMVTGSDTAEFSQSSDGGASYDMNFGSFTKQ